MTTYRNLSGNSSVRYYYSYGSSIKIRFSGVGRWGGIRSSTYIYTYYSAGSSVIEYMKSLASRGKGLNSYVNRRQPRYSDRY